ncbi:hypothetical protein DPMN_132858 [Dreissena polymorpha]|uniref:CxC1-like cysteine cluster associated with KDZ transposases domain-containing protein n=1 Tax=Dreissena polymorpha TaxID=45954 RepID=A0A9D4FUK5_DREPO|nr:hypothetical protein DPMN_132858 [Dreissena polymorpha]
MYASTIFVVDHEGQQHECRASFCPCEESALTFIRYNLWPALPTNPKTGFDLRFMELLNILQLECHMPAKLSKKL